MIVTLVVALLASLLVAWVVFVGLRRSRRADRELVIDLTVGQRQAEERLATQLGPPGDHEVQLPTVDAGAAYAAVERLRDASPD